MNHYKIKRSNEHLAEEERWRRKEGLELKGVEGRRLLARKWETSFHTTSGELIHSQQSLLVRRS